MQNVEQDHRVGDVPNLLILSSGKRNVNQGPSNDAGAAVVEQLKVPELAEAGIHFNAHE